MTRRSSWFHVHNEWPGFTVRIGYYDQERKDRLDFMCVLSDEELRDLHRAIGQAIADMDSENK